MEHKAAARAVLREHPYDRNGLAVEFGFKRTVRNLLYGMFLPLSEMGYWFPFLRFNHFRFGILAFHRDVHCEHDVRTFTGDSEE